MKEIISHKEARSLGRAFYYTGKRCGNGHNSERYTSNRMCKECVIERVTKTRQNEKA
jgi:hypothetical protein